MTTGRTIGDVAELVRSKNAGPFWQTLDIFLPDDETYRAVVDAGVVDETTVAALYDVPESSISIYLLPAIRVVKVSFPRPTSQGGARDRDMHAGQQHVPIATLEL